MLSYKIDTFEQECLCNTLMYENYLTDHGFSFEETEDRKIVMDEENMRIVVDLNKGIDVRVLYKGKQMDLKKGGFGKIAYFSSEDGMWFVRELTDFSGIHMSDIIELIERRIAQIEQTALLVLEDA